MKSIKSVTLAALLTIGSFGMVTYTACNKDECKDVVCLNGGSCSDGNCNCATGWEGNRCQTASGAKFVASWRTTTENCTVSGANAQYDISIVLSGTDSTKLLITNLYDAGLNTTASMTGTNSFQIATQTFGTGQISGSGTLTNNQVQVTYTVTIGSVSDVCNNVTFDKL